MKNTLHINIIHRIKNRIRLRMDHPVTDFKKLKFQVSEHMGIENFQYNPVTRSILVNYDENIVNPEEVLIRIAVSYSLEHDHLPVKITQSGSSDQFITQKGILSGLIILTSVFVNSSSSNPLLKTTMNWMSVISTSAAVLEHAAVDYRTKGTVDPEVLSLGLLGNSVVNNSNFIIPSALTWVSTFGRHFFQNFDYGIQIHITKKKQSDKKVFYHINVSKTINSNHIVELLNKLADNFLSKDKGYQNAIFEGAKRMVNSHDEFIEGVGEKVDGMILNFNQ